MCGADESRGWGAEAAAVGYCKQGGLSYTNMCAEPWVPLRMSVG